MFLPHPYILPDESSARILYDKDAIATMGLSPKYDDGIA